MKLFFPLERSSFATLALFVLIAIAALAPKCARCGVAIIGHGVQAYGAIYCCAHCARGEGVDRVRDRVS